MDNQRLLFDTPDDSQVIHDYMDVPGLMFSSGFVASSDQHEILDDLDGREWLVDLKRRVQHYGYKYDYRARRVDHSMYVGELPKFAQQLAGALVANGLMPKMADQLIINEYQPGQGISAHIDCEPCFEDFIATISLGWEYEMDLISTTSDRKVSVMLPIGSALIFSGDARNYWKHQIRARKSDNGIPRQRRVSLTFRTVILENGE